MARSSRACATSDTASGPARSSCRCARVRSASSIRCAWSTARTRWWNSEEKHREAHQPRERGDPTAAVRPTDAGANAAGLPFSGRGGRCGTGSGAPVVVPTLARLEDDDAGPCDAPVAALVDEVRHGVKGVPAEREDPALRVANRDEVARPEHLRGLGRLVGSHFTAESEQALAPDGQQGRVEMWEAGRDVDQLREVARVARDVDARLVRFEDVAVLHDAVVGGDRGHLEIADRGGVPPAEVGDAGEPELRQALVELERRDHL